MKDEGTGRRPYKLAPAPVERVWGGAAAAAVFGWRAPEGRRIGEWWVLSFRRDAPSVVAEAPFEGIPLPQLTAAHPELLGPEGRPDLLVKIIDSEARLSVQAHPDDALAREMGLDSGKTECWVFLSSRPGARIYFGLREGTDPELFFRRARENAPPAVMEAMLNSVPVEEGACAFIRAGTLHAIGEGVLLLEVQQNSDTTFRIYDWGRPREVHLEAAERAVKRCGVLTAEIEPPRPAGVLVACDKFVLERLRFAGEEPLSPREETWSGLTCIGGSGTIGRPDYESSFAAGDTYFLPAGCPALRVRPRGGEAVFAAYRSPRKGKGGPSRT